MSRVQSLIANLEPVFAEATPDEAVARDRTGRFDRARFESCAEQGVLRAALPHEALPHEWGGEGLSEVELAELLEGLGALSADTSLPLALGIQMLSVLRPIARHASPALRERVVPELAAGRLIGAHAASEEEAGSDFSAIRLTARPDGEGYRLFGHKVWVSLLPVAGLALVYGRVVRDGDEAEGALTAFIVDLDTPGVHVEDVGEKVGLRSVPQGRLDCDGCLVAEEARLGPEGAGGALFQGVMEAERGLLVAVFVGAMARLRDRCTARARERAPGGTPLIERQAVAHALARMQIRIDGGRALVHAIAESRDRRRRAPRQAAGTKLQVTESWVESSLEAMRLFGAQGYLVETGVDRSLRDAVGALSLAGPSNVLLDVVAGGL